ncbi:MAG: sigma-70 family RNA polymerase sigma factor [Paludibacter sp.]|nr:sigma-70 family RNA polymerase sigma factor [Paludibacter sp.]MBP7612044.1 sigma-70 family RNA polymerase sigma factor [Paludibacter sp.]
MNEKESRERDLNLWNTFRDGSEKAFSAIYHEYVQDLYRYGLKFNPDSELVKDCIQELFIKLYNNRQNLNTTDNIRLYLFKALKNRLIDIHYSHKSTVSLSDNEMPFEIANPDEPDTEDDWIMIVKKRKLQKSMESLTSRQREAIYLRFTKEMSLDEICLLLDLNNQSARNLIHRSIEKLRKEFLITIALIFLFNI